MSWTAETNFSQQKSANWRFLFIHSSVHHSYISSAEAQLKKPILHFGCSLCALQD